LLPFHRDALTNCRNIGGKIINFPAAKDRQERIYV
jgi:hypothetical protein